jgi:hypothetical protein
MEGWYSSMVPDIQPKAVQTHADQQPATQENSPDRCVYRRTSTIKYKECGACSDKAFIIHEEFILRYPDKLIPSSLIPQSSIITVPNIQEDICHYKIHGETGGVLSLSVI